MFVCLFGQHSFCLPTQNKLENSTLPSDTYNAAFEFIISQQNSAQIMPYNTLAIASTDSALIDSLVLKRWDNANSNWKPITSAYSGYEYPKTLYNYDKHGNKKTCMNYNWDSLSKRWKVSSQYEYTYNTKQERTNVIGYYWNIHSKNWNKIWKYEYAYDEDGNRTQYSLYSWNVTQKTWKGDWKYQFTFKATNQHTRTIRYNWNVNKNTWQESLKSDFIFDEFGNQISQISYRWDTQSNSWLGIWKNDISYNTNGNQLTSVSYNFNVTSGSWIEAQKYEYEYDKNNNLQFMLGYTWNPIIKNWQPISKHEYETDSNGNIIYFACSKWTDIKHWEILEKTKSDFEYDKNENPTEIINHIWSNTTNSWVVTDKYTLLWNDRGRRTSCTYHLWDLNLYQWHGIWKVENKYNDTTQVISEYMSNWNLGANDWEESNKIEWYYSLHTLSYKFKQHEFNGNLVRLYPQQFVNGVNIELIDPLKPITIHIYDLKGLLLHKQWLSGSDFIDLSHLKAGIYIYRCTSGKLNQTGKLINY